MGHSNTTVAVVQMTWTLRYVDDRVFEGGALGSTYWTVIFSVDGGVAGMVTSHHGETS